MRNNKKGFTIVELVIVIAVIAILAAVLIPTFSSVTNSARASAAQQQAKAGLDSIIALTEGAMPDGTLFLVTGNPEKNDIDYSFVYTGNKLTQVDKSKAEIEKYDTTNNVYAVYVTSKAFVASTVSSTAQEYKDAKAIRDNVETLLLNAIKTLAGYTEAASVSIDINNLSNDYYTLNVLDGENHSLLGTDTFRVYYTSDIQETMVVFIGNE